MTASLQGIWTQKGLDKETAFRVDGTRKKLTHVAVGDGNGSIPIVSAAQTGLVHEVWRGLVNAVMVNPDDPTDMLVDTIIPNNIGGFWIREWGIFDEDGDLVAVGPHDEMHKPLISTGQAAEFLERFHLPSANAGFVTIKIKSEALATQQYVESEIGRHDASLLSHIDMRASLGTLAARDVCEWRLTASVSAGGTLVLPTDYEVGSKTLLLFCESCGLISPSYYEESGESGGRSQSVRLAFGLPAGTLMTQVLLAGGSSGAGGGGSGGGGTLPPDVLEAINTAVATANTASRTASEAAARADAAIARMGVAITLEDSQ